MINYIGFIILILISLIIFIPFNDRFWNFYNHINLKRDINTKSDITKTDLNSVTNDYNSGLIDYHDFKLELNNLYPNINLLTIDKIHQRNNYFETEEILLHVEN
jgi:hypothetical protein